MSGNGFTLLEIIVTVAIIGLLTGVLATALPQARESQSLILFEQQFQNALRESQLRAFNGENGRRHGVLIDNGNIITFVDSDGDGFYVAGTDATTLTQELPPGVTVASLSQVFVWQAAPPVVNLEINAVPITGENDPNAIVEATVGERTVKLRVQPFGAIVKEDDEENVQ